MVDFGRTGAGDPNNYNEDRAALLRNRPRSITRSEIPFAMARDEKRQAVRVARPLECEYSADCPPIRATVCDLSDKGMFLDTQHPLHVGDVIDFRLELPDERETPVTGRGRVVWIEPLVGVGIQFLELSPDQRERLRFWVASVFFGTG